MGRILKIGLWLIGLWVASAASSTELDLGLKAYKAGDYETALRVLRPLAEQGIARAQFILGLMADSGEGIVKDQRQAAKWYQLAAEQGSAYSQVSLGYLYFFGEGVRKDKVYALMWFNLATSRGYKQASEAKKTISNIMTPSQIEKAQELARQCVKKNYKDC